MLTLNHLDFVVASHRGTFRFSSQLTFIAEQKELHKKEEEKCMSNFATAYRIFKIIIILLWDNSPDLDTVESDMDKVPRSTHQTLNAACYQGTDWFLNFSPEIQYFKIV